VEQILNTTCNPIESYRICNAILSLASESIPEYVEKASREALDMELFSYKYFKMLLAKHSQYGGTTRKEKIIDHKNIRRSKAFAGGTANA
jgi:hypothetical protein